MRRERPPRIVAAAYALVQLMAPCWITPAAAAEEYENARLGFSFQLPPGGVRCAPDPSTGPEHGTIVWLDGAGGECGVNASRPSITALGYSNAMFWASPDVALQHDCMGGKRVKPPRLELTGHSSAVCQVLNRDGWIDVELAAMAGMWPKPETAPEMLYTVSLYTTKERLNQDLDSMREVLSSFKIFPQQ